MSLRQIFLYLNCVSIYALDIYRENYHLYPKEVEPPTLTISSGIPLRTSAAVASASNLTNTTEPTYSSSVDLCATDIPNCKANIGNGTLAPMRQKIEVWDGFELEPHPVFDPIVLYSVYNMSIIEFEDAADLTNSNLRSTRNASNLWNAVTDSPIPFESTAEILREIAQNNDTLKRAIQEMWYAPVTPEYKETLEKSFSWGAAAIKDKSNLTFNDVYFHALGSTINPSASIIVLNEIKTIEDLLYSGNSSHTSLAKRKFQPEAMELYFEEFKANIQFEIDQGMRPGTDMLELTRTALAFGNYLQKNYGRAETIRGQISTILKSFGSVIKHWFQTSYGEESFRYHDTAMNRAIDRLKDLFTKESARVTNQKIDAAIQQWPEAKEKADKARVQAEDAREQERVKEEKARLPEKVKTLELQLEPVEKEVRDAFNYLIDRPYGLPLSDSTKNEINKLYKKRDKLAAELERAKAELELEREAADPTYKERRDKELERIKAQQEEEEKKRIIALEEQRKKRQEEWQRENKLRKAEEMVKEKEAQEHEKKVKAALDAMDAEEASRGSSEHADFHAEGAAEPHGAPRPETLDNHPQPSEPETMDKPAGDIGQSDAVRPASVEVARPPTVPNHVR